MVHIAQKHSHTGNAATDTHLVLGILVGASIQQQPRAVRVTYISGPNQRRISPLRRVCQCAAAAAATAYTCSCNSKYLIEQQTRIRTFRSRRMNTHVTKQRKTSGKRVEGRINHHHNRRRNQFSNKRAYSKVRACGAPGPGTQYRHPGSAARLCRPLDHFSRPQATGCTMGSAMNNTIHK